MKIVAEKKKLLNMKEFERRFLVKKELLPAGFPPTEIQQGYLMKENNRVLRIRIESNKFHKSKICFKVYNSSIDRDEYEYAVPYHHAKELLKLCPRILKKTRYIGDFLEGKYVYIDEYSNGLLIAEIEYEGEFPKNLPNYIGEEVTGIEKYSNFYLMESI